MLAAPSASLLAAKSLRSDSCCSSASSDGGSCHVSTDSPAQSLSQVATPVTKYSIDYSSRVEQSSEFSSELCRDARSPSVSAPGHGSCASEATLSPESSALTPGTVIPFPAAGPQLWRLG